MTDEIPVIPGLNRRMLLRGGLVAGASLAVAGLGTVGLTGVAEAALTFKTQQDWAYCANCTSLWYTGNKTAGVCAYAVLYLNEPYGGHVKSPSFSYELRYDISGSGGPSYQAGWDWCSACQCLFYANVENLSANYCAANLGENHKFGGFAYSVLYNDAVTGASQAGWWWCFQCQGLFNSSTGIGGWCPAPTGGPHSAITESGKLDSLAYDVSYYSTSSP
jgi:hypothetical protein